MLGLGLLHRIKWEFVIIGICLDVAAHDLILIKPNFGWNSVFFHRKAHEIVFESNVFKIYDRMIKIWSFFFWNLYCFENQIMFYTSGTPYVSSYELLHSYNNLILFRYFLLIVWRLKRTRFFQAWQYTCVLPFSFIFLIKLTQF